jgi:periplasmic divalent cation tolerance protein
MTNIIHNDDIAGDGTNTMTPYQLDLKILWVIFLGKYAISCMDYLLILCSVTSEYAQIIISTLLEKRLIACGSMLNGKSWFHWKGAVEQEDETVLLMKSRSDKWDAIQKAIIQLHPYKVPEIIAVPIVIGLPEYCSWIDEVLDCEE